MLLLGTRRLPTPNRYVILVHAQVNKHTCRRQSILVDPTLTCESELALGRVWFGRRLLGLVRDVEGSCTAALEERLEFRCYLTGLLRLEEVTACVEINQCVGCTIILH